MIGLCLLTGCVVTTTSYLAKPNDQNNLFLANIEALAKDETSNNGKTCYYINVQSSDPPRLLSCSTCKYEYGHGLPTAKCPDVTE